jgi:hypothetical protein
VLEGSRAAKTTSLARRFPPPWSIDELEACFVVRDHCGQALLFLAYTSQN